MEKLQPSVVAVLQHRHCKREVTIILMEACHQSTSSLLSFFMSPFCQWVRCAQVISIYGERFKLQRSPGAVWINLVFRIGKMSKWAKNILVTATDCGSKFLDLQHIWTHQYQIYIYIVPTCVVPWPMAYFRDLSKPQKSRFAHRDLNKRTQPAASTLTLNNSQSSLAAPANFSAFPWLPGEGMTRYDRMTVRCCDGFGTPKNPWGFSITKGLAQDGF